MAVTNLVPQRARNGPRMANFLLVSANRHAESEHEYLDTEIYEFNVADGALRALTNRKGPDSNPDVSPNGKMDRPTPDLTDRYQGPSNHKALHREPATARRRPVPSPTKLDRGHSVAALGARQLWESISSTTTKVTPKSASATPDGNFKKDCRPRP